MQRIVGNSAQSLVRTPAVNDLNAGEVRHYMM